MIDLLNDQDAQITERDMVCSICWGSLGIHHAPDRMNKVLCRSCGENTRGYVSKAMAEHRRAESLAELLEVKRAYPELAAPEILAMPEAVLEIDDALRKAKKRVMDEIDEQLGF